MIKKSIYLLLVVYLLINQAAHADLHLELTQGIDSALPIAVVPFAGQNTNNSTTKVAAIIQQDLQNSGRFNPLDANAMMQFPNSISSVDRSYWKSAKVNDVVVGSVKSSGNGLYTVSFGLINLYAKPVAGANPQTQGVLASQTFNNVPAAALRAMGHHIADIVYQKLMNKRGIFSTKIAYVVQLNSSNYRLEVSDYDGYNPQTVLRSTAPIMSPAWSPDGKELAYVSFEHGNPTIYISTLATGKRRVAANFQGINSAPAFSPDGKKLALVLSLTDSLNIYIKNLSTGKLQQVTNDVDAIDTEPDWSPDGQKLLFTSDAGGSPQIYQTDLNTNKTMRLTFNGSYNARASYTPDGQSIVILHRMDDGTYTIAIQDLSSGRLQILAEPPGTQSPSIAPNGDMIIYNFRDTNNRHLLGVISTDGKVQIRLPSLDGDAKDPAWSPFL